MQEKVRILQQGKIIKALMKRIGGKILKKIAEDDYIFSKPSIFLTENSAVQEYKV